MVLWLWICNLLFCLQRTLAANVELATALTEKKRDCRKLKRANELKDGQIASLEEARKKDEGKNYLPSSHPTSHTHFILFRQPDLGGKFTVL